MNGLAQDGSAFAVSLFSNIDKDIILYLLTVFTYGILTLILMSIIQAALSSKTTNMSEAGNTVSFLMTITIVMYFLTLFVITPYTKMSTILYIISCIPLLSNYFVPAIMIIGQATPIQIIVSLLLLVASIPVAFKVCAKMFKNGVLDYKGNGKAKKIVKKEKSLEEAEEEKIQKATFRKFAFVIGVVIISWISIQLLSSLIIGVLGTSLLNNIFTDTQISLIMLGITSIVSIVVPMAFISMYIEKEYKVKKNTTVKKSAVIIIISLLLVTILQVVLSIIYPKIGIDYNAIESIFVNSSDSVFTKILYFVCIAVIPAIFEELLFRKMLIDYSRKIGNGFAIIVSALIFGIIHLNLSQTIFAFLLGLLFAIIYTKTGSIKTTMLIHFINNGFAAITVIFKDNVNLIGICTLIFLVVSAIITIYQIIKNRKKINFKNIKLAKIDTRNLKKYRYILSDYTFLVTILITALLFLATENMLHML